MVHEINRAVVVEDSPSMRELIHIALGAFKAKEIVDAVDGVEALRVLQDKPTDIILMDWKMEGMDGLECTRRIRAGVEGISPAIPIILLTGVTGPEAEASAYEAGVSLYMAKPLSLKKLFAGLANVLADGS